ncbi:MAG TPA: hypothetical protein DCP63_07930 [Bacteroidetes bacterium]|nr:hypothetical protein [Bacteroidota bacterium]
MNTPRRSKDDHLKINHRVVRNINRSLILNVIREKQPISRSEIAGVTKLNKSTVSSIVEALVAEELVTEHTNVTKKVGRNPINLQLTQEKHLVGAIYFDSAKTSIALVDIDGSIKREKAIPPPTKWTNDFVIRCLKEVQLLVREVPQAKIKGIGVSVAGVVDSMNSRVLFAPNLGWEDFDLGALIKSEWPTVGQITIENDARASALAELWFGKHSIGLSSFVFLSIGRGIGTGIVVDRRILNGTTHAAGEFGHSTLIDNGEPCSCGNRGCWEAYASDRATVSRYRTASKRPIDSQYELTIEEVVALGQSGDAAARDALRQTGHYLGVGVENIIRGVDPEAIIVGGAITKAWDVVYPEIIESINRHTYFWKHHKVSILPTSLTVNAALLGAAALPIRRIFSDFKVTHQQYHGIAPAFG